MAELLCIKTVGGIQPCTDYGRELFQKWKLNDTLLVTIKRPRNGMHHRKFYALLNLTLSNQNCYKNLEELKAAVIINAGYYNTILLMDGSVHLRPKSISFASMKQPEFDQLYSAVIDSCLKLLPGTTSEEIEREIAAF